MLANLDFVLFDNDNKSNQNVILVTSSIKGEGKTLISLNAAKLMSEKNKRVIVIGADLRNPQLHKLIGIKKQIGSFRLYFNTEIDWAKQLIKMDNLDILLSGTIPPNPTELLSSNKFKSFIEEVRQKYDYVFIDSAPCLLISDTLELSKYVDYTLYVVRSGFSDLKLCDFINDISSNNKIKKINLVLNDVGNNRFYKYQYNYKYSYKYKYNYGYGYGYESDS